MQLSHRIFKSNIINSRQANITIPCKDPTYYAHSNSDIELTANTSFKEIQLTPIV